MARPGMFNLIDRLRRMLNAPGASVWSDDELQGLLDQNRIEFRGVTLEMVPRLIDGATVYVLYRAPHGNLEEIDATDEGAFRLYSGSGAVASSSTYVADYLTGQIVFTANQSGATYYLDGRSYDLNGAAAMGWLEAMGTKAGYYDFETGGQRFTHSQWFAHCREMVEMYSKLMRRQQARVLRA